jgi:hypothetical protein
MSEEIRMREEIRAWITQQEGKLPHLRSGLAPDRVAALLAHLDALTAERAGAGDPEHVSSPVWFAAREVCDLARCYEDSFAEIEAEWPEMGSALRDLSGALFSDSAPPVTDAMVETAARALCAWDNKHSEVFAGIGPWDAQTEATKALYRDMARCALTAALAAAPREPVL